MADATKLVSTAARETVQNIDERYDGYHAALVTRFTKVIRKLKCEPGPIRQRRKIRKLVRNFAREVAAKSEAKQ